VVRAPDLTVAVARAEACRRLGNATSAEEALVAAPTVAPPQVRAAALRIQLLCLLARDPASAITLADACRAEWGDPPEDAGLRAALAAVGAATRTPGWEPDLAASAGAAGRAGDPMSARWSAWLLVETLAADGRVGAAERAAARAAEACRPDLAYSWQSRFLAAELWCAALRGSDPDGVARRATDLLDRTLPPEARALTTAAAALVEADSGLLATARRRLADPALPVVPIGAAGILDWVGREVAWLDGQPPPISSRPDLAAGPLLGGLRRITAFWAGYDGQVAGHPEDDPEPIEPPAVVRETLDTWIAATSSGPISRARDAAIARRFERAARAWPELARREQVRCLLARGLFDPDPGTAVAPLLEARKLAADAGLDVLLDRVDGLLHRYGAPAEGIGRTGADLTDRERETLTLVARGLPARRIAGMLGLGRPAVETTIRSAAGRLGTHVRTVAAARLLAGARD
jgi:DNA-binding CsgD family transcriptional regulator